jgi:hypothetical protein
MSDPEPNITTRYITPDEGMYVTYANNFLINWTAHDVRIKFGTLKDREWDIYVIEHQAAVYISWPEAKELLEVLGKLVDEFEKINGRIALPKVPQLLLPYRVSRWSALWQVHYHDFKIRIPYFPRNDSGESILRITRLEDSVPIAPVRGVLASRMWHPA